MDAIKKEMEKMDKWTEELVLWETTTQSNYKMKLKCWRYFQGACKKISKVDFRNLDQQLKEVVDVLSDLYIPDLYEKLESK